VNGGAERRRHPRVPIGADPPLTTLPTSATVQVLDISEHGALLAAAHPLEVGRRANLRVRLGAEPMVLQVEVRRVSHAPGPARTAYRMGAVFVDLDEDVRRKLDAFLQVQH
jgi:c-di-GMP-binding flagellar brake protein YcgR